MASTLSERCKFVAFYGYKGGAGRSLLAANVAYTLSASIKREAASASPARDLRGQNVLLIDWDLEAPGVGDFLDAVGPGTGPRRISEAWQQQRGIFDLLSECAEDGGELKGPIERFLTKNLINVRRREPSSLEPTASLSGSLSLLGPALMVGREYEAELLTVNWLDFFRSKGEQFALAFSDACTSLGYDLVIIDTRTGINLTTLYVLRWLAHEVFFISPKSHQALEGTRRMWSVLRKMSGPGERPEQSLVLSRHQDGIHKEIDAYIKEAFTGNHLTFEFPHIAALRNDEQLFFEGNVLDGTLQSSSLSLEFIRLCNKVGGAALRLSDLSFLT